MCNYILRFLVSCCLWHEFMRAIRVTCKSKCPFLLPEISCANDNVQSISSQSYTTNYCIETNVNTWVASAMLSNAINDTLVFLAISYRIASLSVGGQGWRSMLSCFFLGDGVPRVAKQLLHHGQLCYLSVPFHTNLYPTI